MQAPVFLLEIQHLKQLKGGGHAKIISIFFISIENLSDILYDVYVCFFKKYDIVVKFGIEKSMF